MKIGMMFFQKFINGPPRRKLKDLSYLKMGNAIAAVGFNN
jgi:hypothetical protein